MARRPPNEPLVLFLDENLDGETIAKALETAGLPIKRLGLEFERSVNDVDWLPAVAEAGWAIVTRDARMRRRPIEREAIMASDAILVCLRGKSLSGKAMAEMVIAAYPRLCRLAEQRRPPMILYVSRSGDVELKEGGERRGGPSEAQR